MSLLDTAIHAAQAAADAIRQARDQPLATKSKGFRDEVTAADFAAERALIDVIHAAYPDHAILSEEGVHDGDDFSAWTPPPGAIWVIDPLDGTTNFARGIPSYATSVAVVVDGVIEAGAIIDPVDDYLFAAARGVGLTVNGAPARVNDRDDFASAVVACDWPREPDARDAVHAIAGRMVAECRTLRCHGSAALNLAYVAAGWFDVYLHLTLKPWDMAAGALMVMEAGGRITTVTGAPFTLNNGAVIASNGPLHAVALAHTRAVLG